MDFMMKQIRMLGQIYDLQKEVANQFFNLLWFMTVSADEADRKNLQRTEGSGKPGEGDRKKVLPSVKRGEDDRQNVLPSVKPGDELGNNTIGMKVELRQRPLFNVASDDDDFMNIPKPVPSSSTIILNSDKPIPRKITKRIVEGMKWITLNEDVICRENCIAQHIGSIHQDCNPGMKRRVVEETRDNRD
ncbi:hypothetical protein L6452_35929 [Arctium lappa]|uniref:Uncharacterized protein n=1 Tax=Arctium lappa TaxID=4217 RepID=A0ACB8Y8H9_ARCLA|nr:hypothetical protein L6452_35929 [Arctium lappa]